MTFTATPGEAGLTFQWFKNGVAIPGATGATYTINQATPADNGAVFQVVVTRPADGSTGSSANATLTVIPGPTVLSVAVSGDRLTLTVTYSKPMGAAALVPGSYTVFGGSSPSVTSAALSGAVVTLTLDSALAANTQYTFTATGVTDPDGNLLIPNPTSKQLFAYQPLVTTAAGDTSAGSLRQVVANAPTGTTITFDPALAGQTITLDGELLVDAARSVTLDASALSGGRDALRQQRHAHRHRGQRREPHAEKPHPHRRQRRRREWRARFTSAGAVVAERLHFHRQRREHHHRRGRRDLQQQRQRAHAHALHLHRQLRHPRRWRRAQPDRGAHGGELHLHRQHAPSSAARSPSRIGGPAAVAHALHHRGQYRDCHRRVGLGEWRRRFFFYDKAATLTNCLVAGNTSTCGADIARYVMAARPPAAAISSATTPASPGSPPARSSAPVRPR